MSRLEAPVQRKSLSGRHQSILSFTTKPTGFNASETTTPSTSSHKPTTNLPTSCFATGDSVASVSTISQAPSSKASTDFASAKTGNLSTAPDRGVAEPVTAGQTTSDRKAVRSKTNKAGGLLSEMQPLKKTSLEPSTGNSLSFWLIQQSNTADCIYTSFFPQLL